MTQQSTLKSYNSFVKGIITEAGPLTFPENASLDEENCVLNRDGSRQRRLGMDFEDAFVLHSVTVLPDDAVGSFIWENAANDVANQLAVIQAGKKLLIFDATKTSISSNLLTTVDLSAYITGKTLLSTSSGLGNLFCAEGSTDPFYLSYNPTTKAVSVTTIDIKIRDIFGVDDGLLVNEEPAALTALHQYNLQNQGWSITNINAYKAEATINVYPSNAQIWFVGKDANEDFKPVQLRKMDFGTSPAPKGRYIIDAFTRSTSRDLFSGLTTTADIETGRPSVVAFGFERVFWSGVKSSVTAAGTTRPNMNGFVFYSRTLRSAADAGQCHTDADPTSEIDSELVETDGGFVNIPNSGIIYKLVQKGPAIVVFAEKGIWMIQGDEGGFSATTHQVIKLSDFGCLSATAIVDIEDALMYWNRGGIYMLGSDDNGAFKADNITENSIQTLYNSISKVAKRNAVGTFDPVNRRIMWMYNDEDTYDGVNYRNKYNRELVLDMVLQAYYKHSISAHESPSPYISGYLPTPDLLLRQEGVRSRGDTVTKYLTVQFLDPVSNAASVSYAYYRDADFRDWKSVDGIGTSFTSYLLTGYEIMGDMARMKGASYLTTHMKFTETEAALVDGQLAAVNPSGCYVQAQWDWSNHVASGKWGTTQQIYRLPRPLLLTDVGATNYGMEVITTKSRLPGSGKSLSLLFTSDGDKDFYLYGWAIKFTGQPSV